MLTRNVGILLKSFPLKITEHRIQLLVHLTQIKNGADDLTAPPADFPPRWRMYISRMSQGSSAAKANAQTRTNLATM
jgi:hypothetical protein